MPKCDISIRPVYVEDALETVYVVDISYAHINPKLNLIHEWIDRNFEDYDTMYYGQRYLFRDIDGFEMAFKLTWS